MKARVLKPFLDRIKKDGKGNPLKRTKDEMIEEPETRIMELFGKGYVQVMPIVKTEGNVTVPTKISELTDDIGLAKKSQVDAIKVPDISTLSNKVNELQNSVDGISIPDVSGLASKAEVESVNKKVEAIQVPDVTGLAKKTEIPDVSGLASKTDLQSVVNSIPDTTGLASKTEVKTVADKLATIVIPDISGLAKKTDIPTQVKANWAETDPSKLPFIENKPILPPSRTAGIYSGVTDSNGDYKITFTQTFSNIPMVAVTLPNQQSDTLRVKVTGLTKTGCTVNVKEQTSVNVVGISVLSASFVNKPGITVDVYVTEK